MYNSFQSNHSGTNLLASLNPRWETIRETKRNDTLIYEIEFDNPKGVFVSRENINTEQAKECFSKNLFRLLFIKNLKTNATKGYYMSIISDNKTDLQEMRFKHVGDFSGDINYYDLNGKFLNGWKYQNGKITTFRRIKYPERPLLMGGGPEKLSQTCSIHGYPVYASYCFELEGSYEACFPKLAGYSYSISCSGSGGGGQYEEIGVEGVDGSPDPYFDCNGDMNGSAYIAGCGCIGGNTGRQQCPDPCADRIKISNTAQNQKIALQNSALRGTIALGGKLKKFNEKVS